MKLGAIIKLWLQENLLLFKDAEKLRYVTTIRVISLVVISVTCVVVYQLFKGIISFDMGFVIGVFAIFISWLFFWSSQRSQDRQEANLLSFLKEMKHESSKDFEDVSQRLDNISAFKDRQTPTPNEEERNKFSEDYANKLSEQMKPDAKQIFLAIAELDRPIEVVQPVYYRYEHGDEIGAGGLLLNYLILQLNEAELVKYNGASLKFVSLTVLGKDFAKWLCDHDQKASYFESPQLTKWGEPSENAERKFEQSFPEWEIYSDKSVAEQQKREMQKYHRK